MLPVRCLSAPARDWYSDRDHLQRYGQGDDHGSAGWTLRDALSEQHGVASIDAVEEQAMIGMLWDAFVVGLGLGTGAAIGVSAVVAGWRRAFRVWP